MPAGKTNSTSEGGRLFADFCAACHGAQGAGIPEVFPALVQNDVVNAKDPTAHVVVILNGIHGRPIGGKPYVTQMPSFSWLNDEEIAAIINFERSSWGNHLPILSAHTVAAVRQAIEHVDQVDSIKRLEF
jgi:mono/diheme cytochrome c family protein